MIQTTGFLVVKKVESKRMMKYQNNQKEKLPDFHALGLTVAYFSNFFYNLIMTDLSFKPVIFRLCSYEKYWISTTPDLTHSSPYAQNFSCAATGSVAFGRSSYPRYQSNPVHLQG